MIPADVASRLQTAADSALRPVAPTQEITDKLSDLTAGQKVLAEIQALLPNGTYRALINQRNITLALPFSAKSGDTLELQVTESDGKLALALVTRQDGDGKAAKEAVSATLSRTGQLISNLFSNVKEGKGEASALVLNGNRPLANTPPNVAQDILPQLKAAIAQSGMFYESHQAEWVEGRFSKSALLQEPQGRLSSPAAFSETAPSAAGSPAPSQAIERAAQAMLTASAQQPGDASPAQRAVTEAVGTQTGGQLVAPQAQPVVQQQLEALATQNFVWQGQVWPGQQMRWEIEEDAGQQHQDEEDSAQNWRTSLSLHLPGLGSVDARIQLHNDQLVLSISSDNDRTCSLMQTEADTLRRQMTDAGLTLTSINVANAEEGRSEE
jgi:hypothetical protein